MDILLLFVLLLLNGTFALAEMSLVAANKIRLQQWAEAGRPGAARALALALDPSRLLSTMQVGITGAGIFAGAFGEGIISQPLEQWLSTVPALSAYAHPVALGLAVFSITLASLLVGELIPKRIALLNPEAFACLLAAPMHGLSRLFAPLVWCLSGMTEASLRLFGVKATSEPTVTQEEIRVLMEQGAEAGVLESAEHDIVNRVFNLDDQRVRAIMTPRSDIVYVDVQHPKSQLIEVLRTHRFARFPVCEGNIDNISGFVGARDVAVYLLDESAQPLQAAARAALYVPDTLNIMEVLQLFKQHRQPQALVVDEYGELQGLVTLHDVVEAMVGRLPSTQSTAQEEVVRLQDGTYLVNGSLSVSRFKELTGITAVLEGEDEGEYHTVAGLVMTSLARIPTEGDAVELHGWRIEVVDMDRNRIDKLRLSATLTP